MVAVRDSGYKRLDMPGNQNSELGKSQMYCCNFMQFEGCHMPAGQEDYYSPMHLIGNLTLEKDILLGEDEH